MRSPEARGRLKQLNVQLLISSRVLISGWRVQAPCWAPWWAWRKEGGGGGESGKRRRKWTAFSWASSHHQQPHHSWASLPHLPPELLLVFASCHSLSPTSASHMLSSLLGWCPPFYSCKIGRCICLERPLPLPLLLPMAHFLFCPIGSCACPSWNLWQCSMS